MKIKKVKLAEVSNLERDEKTGDCFRSESTHYYLVRDEDVLHVNDTLINSLPANAVTSLSDIFKKDFTKISRSEFNVALNKTVFELDYFGEEYKA